MRDYIEQYESGTIDHDIGSFESRYSRGREREEKRQREREQARPAGTPCPMGAGSRTLLQIVLEARRGPFSASPLPC